MQRSRGSCGSSALDLKNDFYQPIPRPIHALMQLYSGIKVRNPKLNLVSHINTYRGGEYVDNGVFGMKGTDSESRVPLQDRHIVLKAVCLKARIKYNPSARRLANHCRENTQSGQEFWRKRRISSVHQQV